MEANTLVTHTKIRSLGIGCVAKKMKRKIRVNFGTDDYIDCEESMLKKVCVKKSKTISFKTFRSRILHDNSSLDFAIVGNELKQFVGIGWITIRVVTEADLKIHPRVIE